eukprot:CAMPEP_0184399938 /NCGR_PEP_ID=MMETSP0007-20130409/72472_1 /TAXON_ID=97485 /ORGANISM="Prymnesium parvum, Strain Texoma1" /LENGTH=80 /DNA_ID=CAMNT_0026754593 /DNA_START=168 /DNA_END=407 /DNA_ORIENTATION=-
MPSCVSNCPTPPAAASHAPSAQHAYAGSAGWLRTPPAAAAPPRAGTNWNAPPVRAASAASTSIAFDSTAAAACGHGAADV